MHNTTELEKVRGWVDGATRVVVLTGAGISTESGIPDFRGPQGVWTKNPGAEKMATLQHYMADPEVRKRAWQSRLDTFARQAEPNAGHRALVELERRGSLHTLITQNVDGLHQRAGSSGVLALHGNIFEDRWLDPPRNCCSQANVLAGNPPGCSVCGNLRRPGVVWFGEPLPLAALSAAQAAADHCELMLVIGTSGVVYPAAGLARRVKGRVVVVNPQPSDLDDAADAVLRGKAAQLLPSLLSLRV